MKIIHIVHGKANPTGHNGISRVVYHLNKQEKLQGVDSEIWALVDDAKYHYTQKRDKYVTVECFPRVRMPFGSHEIIERLVAKKNSNCLVHFHLIWFYDKNIIASALNRAGIPFIITTHGTYSKPHAYTGKRRLAKWLFEVDYLNMATEIHTITREEGTGLQAYGYRGRSFVAYNGIDLDEVPEKRSRDFYADKPYRDKTKLIWVGVLRDDKNLCGLIEAVTMLPENERKQLVCVLVGPDYKGNASKYLAMARSLGCSENFDYIGPLYDQHKYDAIESADVYVMPSFSEVFSLAMLDAMACAKPCLVTTGCGYNYFIFDDFFVPCEPYPQDIAYGIERILGRRAEWPRMGSNGRQAIEQKFNWKSIAQVMINNYARISNGSRNVVE
jgi:glycosyltransferase involved in cell wall biosynthesis